MNEALLLSGGMDSIALLWWRRPRFAYLVDYGQFPYEGEARAARAATAVTGTELRTLRADVRDLGAGDLAHRPGAAPSPSSDWWPFRNQHLITVAAMAAVQDSVARILIGSVAEDDVHSDGSHAFVEAFDQVLRLQEGHLELQAPAKHLTTVQLAATSRVPMDVLRLAHSCHVAAWPCGRCRGCMKYARVWEEIESGRSR